LRSPRDVLGRTACQERLFLADDGPANANADSRPEEGLQPKDLDCDRKTRLARQNFRDSALGVIRSTERLSRS
jgi:hypothetical protein